MRRRKPTHGINGRACCLASLSLTSAALSGSSSDWLPHEHIAGWS